MSEPKPDTERGQQPVEPLVRAVWLTAEEVDFVRECMAAMSHRGKPSVNDAIDRELNRARHRPGVFKLSARGDVDR